MGEAQIDFKVTSYTKEILSDEENRKDETNQNFKASWNASNTTVDALERSHDSQCFLKSFIRKTYSVFALNVLVSILVAYVSVVFRLEVFKSETVFFCVYIFVLTLCFAFDFVKTIRTQFPFNYIVSTTAAIFFGFIIAPTPGNISYTIMATSIVVVAGTLLTAAAGFCKTANPQTYLAILCVLVFVPFVGIIVCAVAQVIIGVIICAMLVVVGYALKFMFDTQKIFAMTYYSSADYVYAAVNHFLSVINMILFTSAALAGIRKAALV